MFQASLGTPTTACLLLSLVRAVDRTDLVKTGRTEVLSLTKWTMTATGLEVVQHWAIHWPQEIGDTQSQTLCVVCAL